MRYHLKPTTMSTVLKMEISVIKDVGKLEPLFMASRNVKWCSFYGEV
jgi:hypothetical protein